MSSEHLASAKNPNKGDLGGSWNILDGASAQYTDLGIARRFGSAAAAYSLRDIGAMNGRVVKVRRDSGETTDPEEDFSANQVSSGALEDWVNGKLEDQLPADVATAQGSYSLRKVKASYSGNAVRIRRGADDAEVNVAFDSDDKVSSSSSISTVSGSTNATDLNGFLNETLSDRFSTVDYPSGIGSDFTKWSALTATSNSFVATTGTFADNTARYNYVLPETLTAAESANTTFRFSGTVDYTASGGTGFIIKQGSNAIASSSHDFANQTSTGVGTIASNVFKFVNGDSGDFSFEFTGNGTNDFRSIVFLQTIVSSGSSSISLTNLKFEIIKHGATVNTWYNQSGDGSNGATQSTSTKQPKIAGNGTLLDHLLFDGTDDFLADTNVSFEGAVSLACLSEKAADGLYPLSAARQAAANRFFAIQEQASTSVFIARNSSSQSISTNTGGDKRLTFTRTNSDTSYSVASMGRGLQTGTNDYGAAPTASLINQVVIGSRETGSSGTPSVGTWNGKIFEAITYQSDQTDNKFKIESNINNYYGLYNDANETNGIFISSNSNSSFTANGKVGFTATSVSSSDGGGAIQLNETLTSGDVLYVSFNSTKDSSTGDGVAMRQTSGGTIASNEQPFKAGFNAFTLTANAANADFVVFMDDSGIEFTISDFRVSRIARNGFVETWYDQSSSGSNATQTTASQQPKIVDNGGIVKNVKGFPSLKFESANSTELDIGLLISNLNSVSAYVVTQKDTGDTNRLAGFTQGVSSNNSRFYLPFYTSGTAPHIGYNDSASKISFGTTLTGTCNLYSVFSGDTNLEAFKNGSSVGTTALVDQDVTATDSKIAQLSNSFRFDGVMSEIFLTTQKLQGDAATINTEVQSYYNL